MKQFWAKQTLSGKLGFGFIVLCVLMTTVGVAILPDTSTDANQHNPAYALARPMTTYTAQNGNEKTFALGSDKYGRDILSRAVRGIGISLTAGMIAIVFAMLIGVIVGLLSGYIGGWFDTIVLFIINSLWAFPTILFVFAVVLAFGRSLTIIFIAVGCTLWIDVARLVRGQTLQIKAMPYIKAAKSYGSSLTTILFKHILPNIMGPLIVVLTTNFAIAILIEAGLSYLGFGVAPPTPSLGNLLNENYGYALAGMPFLAIVPALLIMLLVLSFNFVSNSLKEYYDL